MTLSQFIVRVVNVTTKTINIILKTGLLYFFKPTNVIF